MKKDINVISLKKTFWKCISKVHLKKYEQMVDSYKD